MHFQSYFQCFFHIAAKCILMPNRETTLEVRAKTALCAINTPLWSTFLCLIQIHFVMHSISRYSNTGKCSMVTACIAKGDLDLDYSQLLKWWYARGGMHREARGWDEALWTRCRAAGQSITKVRCLLRSENIKLKIRTVNLNALQNIM